MTTRRQQKKLGIALMCVALILTVALFLFFSVFGRQDATAAETSTSYLLCGLDDAGANTDVMVLCFADRDAHRVTLLQIPRDTLYRNDDGQIVKINSLYARYLATGEDKGTAARMTRETLSNALSLRIDGALMLDGDLLASLVDALGGITLSVPQSFIYEKEDGKSIRLDAGTQKLNGEKALAFLRHRQGYLRGDLDRMDAQKLFFGALAQRVSKGLSFTDALRLIALSGKAHFVSDFGLREASSRLRVLLSALKNADIRMATLPGEALYENRTWYYVACRMASGRLIDEQLAAFKVGELDPERRLVCEDIRSVKNAYEQKNTEYRLYALSELDGILRS